MPWPFTRKSEAALATQTEETSTSARARFSFKLFRELTADSGSPNVLLSPSSVMLCAALVRELSSGETRQGMSAVLEIAGRDASKVETEIAALKSALRQRADAEVSFANALWLSKHAHIAPELAARLRVLYESELASVDFGHPDAASRINAWVDTKTKGKIARIVNKLSPLAALVAVNAVYFKGLWIEPFHKEFTLDAPFTTATGQTKQFPMMLQSGRYRYYEDESVQLAALPYKGGVSMHVVLPAVGSNLRQFQQSLTAGRWESWGANLRREKGTIRLPRFKVDFEAQLNNALTTLGMERAFDPDRAEFGQIQTDVPPVWIDQVSHRAVAEVNEAGTEAAAVTAFTHMRGSPMNRKPERSFQMVVNRPFFLAICDDKTNTILFMGWIGDPQ
ncbi:MAG TPA: serpin family protein [Candidatus Sulfotelmatobacter sp.]|nr:serpin family protein [Candidatus Sulfotelmatobacter sp.]